MNKMAVKGKNKSENLMRAIKIEKIILSCSGVKDELEKSFKLLQKISGKTPTKRKTTKRIPNFDIRPNMEVGCMVTLRGPESIKLLGRLLSAIENKLRLKQIAENHFSFGIEEYIEIPGEKYDREIGMTGLKVTVVFARKGKRTGRKKIKRGIIPAKQNVNREEIIKFMEGNFKTKFLK